jgi:hypothetical protein
MAGRPRCAESICRDGVGGTVRVVALVRFHDEDEYWPEFGTIVIRDAASTTGRWQDFQSRALDEHEGPLFGTVARAGEGWLQMNAGDEPHRVRVEVHDRPVAAPDEPWLDVMETPYSCGTGAVGLTTMTSGPGYYGVMEVGAPGSYRVRVCRRSGDDAGGWWLVQFWPDDHVLPPRWLVRRPRSTPGWTYQSTDPATVFPDVYALVSWSPNATVVTTVTDLSRRLLLDEQIITRTLRPPHRHLHVTGNPDDHAAPLTVTLATR